MGLVLFDGLEDISSWAAGGTGGTTTIVPGRNGNGFSMNLGGGQVFTIPPVHEADTVTVGFAWRLTSSSTGFMAQLASDNGSTIHDRLELASGNAISVTRAGTSLATSGAGVLALLNTWYYIEWQCKLGDSPNGATTVRVNGTTVISATGLDTKNAGTKTVYDRFILQNAIATSALYDDVYLFTAPTTPEPFLGDLAVETLYPNGDGNANQWVGSDGDSVSNYLLVDEAQVSTADYVQSTTAGHQDLYNLTSLVRTTGTIHGVCHQGYAAKADSGARQIKLVNRGSTDTKSGAMDLTTSYTPFHYSLAQDPETSAAWTFANVNALQSGIELV